MRAFFSWLVVSLFLPVLVSASDTPEGLLEFQISGGSVLPALIDADVEIHIGDQVFDGNTDESGRFSLDVGCGGNLDALVMVKAYGTGDQEGLAMARVSESCGNLRDAATGNPLVSEIGLLSPVSSGLFATVRWHVQDQDGLDWPPTRSALHDQLGVLQANHTGLAARALVYIDQALAALPTGFSNTLELLDNRQALVEFNQAVESSVDQETVLAALKTAFWNAQLYDRPSIPAPPERLFTWCPALQSACDYYVELLEDGDASYTINAFSGAGEWFDRGMVDALFGDRMEIPEDNLRALRLQGVDGEPLTTALAFVTRWIDGEPVQVAMEVRTVWADFRLPDASELIDLLAVDTLVERVYPNNPELPTETFPQSLPSFASGKTQLDALPAWTPPQVGERWALALANPEQNPQRPLTADIIEFIDSTSAESVIENSTYTWAVSDGILTLVGDDTSYSFTHLGAFPDRHRAFLASIETAGQQTSYNHIVGIQASSAAGFDETDIAGRYVGAFSLDNAIPIPLEYPITYFIFDLFPDGTGVNATLGAMDASMPSNAIPLTWTVDEEGGLIINRQFNELISSWRRWLPVAEVPNSSDLYLLETQPEFVNAGDEPSFAEYRLNYYRRFDLPD